ncbi:hypothetical protein SPRG_01023 [Saprolegnia parasitica CBS 223.65]|uniref:Uncharacterized protein n=1 Tax=Saprolegnia parasitica (strain CBS 223.65) TaxID=695850 RepID=A0A067D8H4_SAPPC|nr:hypothetical protein SPRG_01023 [Saprolegnia parasitica CBS 223.65]KDO34961.1 hypothetical protein SPRG_01023 [Saprolegnia parasitica CBS 223.65]|eukprot:XP_012194615.1 hypothetical protein SPRG_01023 [Saprolegnia parasitica CBS 223.65]
MDASTKVMVQSAALQSRTTVPVARHFDAVSTHYRYMDADATAKDGEDRARIIRELKAKRSKAKGAGTKTAFEAALEVHAQERDLAVVERLIQEKNAAEAKAKQLEALLWEQPAKVHPTPQSSRPKATKKRDLVIDAGESFFNDIHGDESAPPDFDIAGPRTASSIEDEPPGFDDIVEEPEPCASPTSSASTKRRERHAANPASDDDAPPSTWATRISSVHSSFLSEETASSNRKRHGSFFEAYDAQCSERLIQIRVTGRSERSKKRPRAPPTRAPSSSAPSTQHRLRVRGRVRDVGKRMCT